ncbi:MAG: MBL fold metallo-hydrolase [Pseudomonadota bacterium]
MTDTRLQIIVVPVTPFQQNCSVLFDTETKFAVVIDPGGDVERIQSVVAEEGLTIQMILLTHGHIDHAGGAADLQERCAAAGRPVEIVGPHRDEAALLGSLERQGMETGMAGARNLTPDRWLEDGDDLTVLGMAFSVLHCPGHSPGSIVFFADALRLAISGDVLFQGSVGRSDLPGGDHATLMRSITEKLLPLGDDVTFLPGHGAASTLGQERATNPFVREALGEAD